MWGFFILKEKCEDRNKLIDKHDKLASGGTEIDGNPFPEPLVANSIQACFNSFVGWAR